MTLPPISTEDIDHILAHTGSLWEELRGRQIFITGGTGFFGCWLLESFLAANHKFHLNAKAVVLTRSAEAFRQKSPHLAADSGIELIEGDIRSFPFPPGDFPFVIHAATESVAKHTINQPLETLSTIVEGTRHCLEMAQARNTKKFLLTSSGAVYGQQPPNLDRIPEDYRGAPDSLSAKSVYAEGKRVAELLCTLYAEHTGMECKIARCFAFVGPHLALDAHFAVGNFIRDAMRGAPILIHGDGTPMRSYLYAADLAVWLWTMLFQAPSLRPFNVGSAQACSIRCIAEEVATALNHGLEIRVAQRAMEGAAPSRYVPDVTRAEAELQLTARISLRQAIQRTAGWHGWADPR